MRRALRFGAGLVGLGLAGILTVPLGTPDPARVNTCWPVERTSAQVGPGVAVTWDSSFGCNDVPAQGAYEVRLTILNSPDSSEPVRVERVVWRKTTPRPGGSRPTASLEHTGLVVVTGRYQLVSTDEGDKANLHLAALGETATGRPFRLGVNLHFRGPGARE